MHWGHVYLFVFPFQVAAILHATPQFGIVHTYREVVGLAQSWSDIRDCHVFREHDFKPVMYGRRAYLSYAFALLHLACQRNIPMLKLLLLLLLLLMMMIIDDHHDHDNYGSL